MKSIICISLAILFLSPDAISRTKKRKKRTGGTFITMGLRSPEVIPFSLQTSVSPKLSLELFGAPPVQFLQKKKIDPTVTEAAPTISFTTDGTEVDAEVQYGLHMGVGSKYRIKRNLYVFNHLSYRETSMAISGQESVALETVAGSLENIAQADIAIDVLYQQLTAGIGLEKRSYLSRNTFIGFQAGLYLPISTQKKIESQFILNRMPSDSSLSSIFADSEEDRRKLAESEVEEELALLETPLPILGLIFAQRI